MFENYVRRHYVRALYTQSVLFKSSVLLSCKQLLCEIIVVREGLMFMDFIPLPTNFCVLESMFFNENF